MCISCEMRVDPRHEGAAVFNRIPCGHCKSCDEVYQKSWSFRLRVEIEKLVEQNWQVGFLTLTYNDMTLPSFPRSVWKDQREFKHIVCFNRDHCESFIRSARSWLWREYNLQGAFACRYMLASEFGAFTKRPHYHLCICVPPFVDMRALYNKLKSLWDYGFVFPRFFEGGMDSHGYRHKGFVCENPLKSGAYVAKYTTKDMYYNEHLEAEGVDVKRDFDYHSRSYRRLAQFHLQSRGLGSSLLDGLTDVEKLDLLKTGYSFVGDDKKYTLPVYFRNKLIFDNVYQYVYDMPSCGQTGEDDIVFVRPKRVVLREANKFFIDNFREIFALKVKKYSDLFKRFSSSGEYCARGILPEVFESPLRCFDEFRQKYNIDYERLASYYLAWYGVPLERIDKSFDLAEQWLGHYCDLYLLDFGNEFVWETPLDSNEVEFYEDLHFVLGRLFNAWYNVKDDYTDEDRSVSLVSDYFKHLA